MNQVLKKYDFFQIYRHSVSKKLVDGFDELGNNYDLSEIDKYLLTRFSADSKKLNPIKLDKYSYAGITNIQLYDGSGVGQSHDSKVDLADSHFWVFSIERANTLKTAVVVQVKKDIQSGRVEYGDSPEEGAASDTVVCFDPNTGVVVLPPRSGMGVSKIESFFYKTTRQRNLVDDVVVDSTSVNSLEHISRINEIVFRVSNIVSDRNSIRNAGISEFNSINNKKMSLKLYGGEMNVHEVIKVIKRLLHRSDKKEISLEQLLVDGQNNDDKQLIDLVNKRMIASNSVTIVNGKIPMDAMMDSVKDAYFSNKTKLDMSNNLKGGKGV
ncbi:hypothetical protein [Lacticaseibacillus paracasei]|uniref:hypothetical protein n=1 Tax=Lacticaseibacillus paracasei TaxID=1597 RepID=UPI003395D5F0